MGESFCQAKHLRAVVGLHGFVATASLDVNYVLLSLEVLFYLFRRGFFGTDRKSESWEDGLGRWIHPAVQGVYSCREYVFSIGIYFLYSISCTLCNP